MSQPICWVSRSTILTGLTGRSFGTPAEPDQVKPEAAKEFYVDLLRANGYRTGHYGKVAHEAAEGEQAAGSL